MSLNFAVCSGTQMYRCILQQVLKFIQHWQKCTDHALLYVLLCTHTVSLYTYCACDFWYALCNF
jgi:hypothetical protein